MPVFVIRWAVVLFFVAAITASIFLPAPTARPVTLALLLMAISAPLAIRRLQLETRLGILGFACAAGLSALAIAVQVQTALGGVAGALSPWPLVGPVLAASLVLPFAPLAWRHLVWTHPENLRRIRLHLIGRCIAGVAISALYVIFASPDAARLAVTLLPIWCALGVTLLTPANVMLAGKVPLFLVTTALGFLVIPTALGMPVWVMCASLLLGGGIGLIIRRLRGVPIRF